jgi:RNA polymerase sigma factor (sigma-70 family)
MLNLARNQAIDCLRSKHYKQNSKNDQVENHLFILDKKHFTTQESDSIGVRDLLDSLNKDQQLIVTLLYFKGYTQSEVSKEYNIPLGTVKTRLRNAIYQLRKILNIK